MQGRVLRVSGLQHQVEVGEEQWQCDLRGRLKAGRRGANSPVIVGDWVEVEATGCRTGVIEKVYPRCSQFSRGASGSRPYEQIVAVNMDQLIVVVAAREPTPRIGFIDRAVVMALKGDMEPALCINKMDLDPDGQIRPVAQVYQDLGYVVCFTSALTGEGIEDFRVLLRGNTSAIVGQSGVGKSSLLNRIEPELSIKTRELMKQHDRGRHTTAAVQLYKLREGGYVADTPGIKELRLWGVDRTNLVDYFAEVGSLMEGCQFRNCTHLHEPGCAVRQAVEQGRVAAVRYDGYRRIMGSL